MNLQKRFIISFGIIFLIVFVIFEILMYQRIYRYEIENLESKAEIVRGILMATRRIYHHQLINSGIPITEKTVGFLPAHALNRISKDFSNWYGSDLSFNNVSDKPRNPNQKADDIEMGAIQYFRANPTQKRRFMHYETRDGTLYYHYARPIWIEKYCLKCHGKKQDAPDAIQQLYNTSYDYSEGELRGILSIKLAAKPLHERIASEFINDMILHFMTFLLIFIAVVMLLKRFVTQPIAAIAEGFNAILHGDYKKTMPNVTHDFAPMVSIANQFKSTNQLLVSKEKHIKNLINSTAEGIYGLDLDGKCTFVNAACLKMTGFNHEDEFLNQHVHNMIHHTKTDGTNHPQSECMACLAFKENKRIHATDEIMWRKDGSHFPIAYRSFPVYEDDKINGCVITFLDITEQKQLELMRHQQERYAQTVHASRLTTLGEMATGIAHEMNQPLAGISYTAAFLKKAFEMKKLHDEDFCDSLKDINGCIKRMSGIINHMRIFARQDTSNTELFDIHETIEGALTLLGEQLRLHGIAVIKDYDRSLPTIECSSSQLEQVWINHITNARDSLDDKAEKIEDLHKSITIATKYNETDETVDIVFTDNGMGMTEEVKNKMFNPFYTTKEVGKGTGLGLSVSHGIISTHKGKYTVDSREGEGTTIKITLPIKIS